MNGQSSQDGIMKELMGVAIPDGLVGIEIPLSVQVVSLADVFDALSQKRSYKDASDVEEVIEYISVKESNKFDKYLLEILKRSKNKLKTLCQ